MKLKKCIIIFLCCITLLLIISCKEKGDGANNMGNNLSYVKTAQIICDELNFSGGDKRATNITDKDAGFESVVACLSRNIFDRVGKDFVLQTDHFLTRFELAKVCVNSYSALLGIESENLQPGKKENITDIAKMEVSQRWYIHVALTNGFVKLIDNKFHPNDLVSEHDLIVALQKVKQKANVDSLSYDDYLKAKDDNFRTFPVLDIPTEKTINFYHANKTQEHDLFAVSLQGLVNRDSVSLFVIHSDNDYILDFAQKNHYFDNRNYIDNFESLCHQYSKYLNKVVVYDTNKQFTVNTAVVVAGVEDRVIVSAKLLDDIKAIIPDVDVFDLREQNFENQYSSQKWMYENYFEYMRRDVLSWSYYANQTNAMRDYIIQMKIPVLWVSKAGTKDFNENSMTLTSKILYSYPVNIPVLGFQYAYDKEAGENVGINEFPGVSFCGEYGKYTVVYDTVGNLSFHSCIKVPYEKRKLPPIKKDFRQYSPSKKYIAIAMTESGDAPVYLENKFYKNQWKDTERKDVPYSYSYSLTSYDILPLYNQFFASSRSKNDYFYNSISGLGYMYPLGGYGSKGASNDNGQYMTTEEIMKDYYRKTNIMCERMGYEGAGMYSYPGGFWSKYDYQYFDNAVDSQLSNIKYYIGDMHRVANRPLQENELIHDTKLNKPIFHCSTFWGNNPIEVCGRPNDIEKDSNAVDFLMKEIRRNTLHKNGQFYVCMAYSWSFGPRRIKLVMDEMANSYANEYEFVTLDELNDLYLQSKYINKGE